MCYDIKKYIKDLNSQDWKTRQYAVERLEISGSPKALNPLIKTLYDVEPSVRWKSAEALGKIKDKRAVPFLVELLNDREGEIRLSCVKALGEIRDVRAVFPLIYMLNDNYIIFQDITVTQGDYRDNSVKGSVIYALQKIGDSGALPALKRMLQFENHPMIRVLLEDAIEHLGYSIEWEESPEEVISLETQEEPAKISSEGKIEEAPARISLKPKILKQSEIVSDEKEEVEKEIPEIGEIKIEETSEPMEEEKGEKESSQIPADTEKELSDETDRGDEDRKTPYQTARLSGEVLEEEIKRQKFEELIKEQIAKFENTCMFTRMDGVQTLEKIGSPAVEFLIKALEDQNWRLREGAAESLTAIGDVSALPAFKKALPIEPEENIKTCLEQVIKKMETEIEVKNCIEKLSDTNMFIQLDAIQILEKIGKPAIPYLIDSLTDSNWKVREGSLDVLSSIGDESIIGSLKEALETESDDYLKKNIQKVMDKFETVPH